MMTTDPSADDEVCTASGEVQRPTTKKSHWEAVFDRELRNYREFGDDGEIWFGTGSVTRIVKWLNAHKLPQDAHILDLGCGNGNTLFALSSAGYTKLYGVDYCEAAVTLCESIAAERGVTIGLKVVDILEENAADHVIEACLTKSAATTESNSSGVYDVLIDKGTYDVVSMRDEESRVRYVELVRRILKADGLLILTTCNWTEAEIGVHFARYMRVEEVLPSGSTFTFGGAAGRTNTTCVLRFHAQSGQS